MPAPAQRQIRPRGTRLAGSATSDRSSAPADAGYSLVTRQQLSSNQAIQRLLRSGTIQAKLTVNQPGDKYEQEADRVASQLMRMSNPETANVSRSVTRIQRACATCGAGKAPCPTCAADDEERLQAKMVSGRSPEVASGVQERIRAVQTGGKSLPEPVRAYFEPRFGHRFRDVRIHTDAKASEAARAINARAFTLGRDIVFGAGQYSPETTSGRQLLAHELTHTIQQSRQGIGDAAAPMVQRLGDQSHAPPDLPCTIADTDTLRSSEHRLDFVFGISSSTLTPQQKQEIADFAEAWTARGSMENIEVDGFASVDGPEGLNWRLSCDRAEAVKRELQGHAVPDTKIRMTAHGESTVFDSSTGGASQANTPNPNRHVVIRTAPAPVPTVPGSVPDSACDAIFSSVSFTLENEQGQSATSAAGTRMDGSSGKPRLQLEGQNPVEYRPTVTIHVPVFSMLNAGIDATDFEAGLIQNLLEDRRRFTYTGGTVVVTAQFPHDPPVNDNTGEDDVFFKGRPPGLVPFTASGFPVPLMLDDLPSDGAFLHLIDEPFCHGIFHRFDATLRLMEMNDKFRTWVGVRHKPSGCVLTLHHIDWETDWLLRVSVSGDNAARGFDRNMNRVTDPNGNGSPRFLFGEPRAAANFGRTCF